MKRTCRNLLLGTIAAIAGTLSAPIAGATSYVPDFVIEEQHAIDKNTDGIICLFHGATPDIFYQILGEVYAVYRTPVVERISSKTVVGKVRLTESVGAHYLEAVKIEGELNAGDVVQLRDHYALVVLTNGHCEALNPPEQKPGL